MSAMPFMPADKSVLQRRDQIVAGLSRLVPRETLILSEAGRRAFETDALTAYRRVPMAVVLPGSTEEVSRVLKFCSESGVKVIPRGAGTSLCGGALPLEDAIVVGVSRMNRILDVNFENRTARVETGVTNLGISNVVSHNQFFYAPDPSSQLACTLAGNIGMNSGGAHCLKYGVTTNNVLGLKMVLMNGDVAEFGGDYLDPGGYDFMGLIIGSEGQFGIVTEATVRILRAAEGARPMLLGFATSEAAGACVSAIIGRGIIPVALEYMDKQAIHITEDFAKAGYPMDVEALLIAEVEGSEEEIQAALKQIADIAQEFDPMVVRVSESEEEAAAIWKGRKAAFGATGRVADYLCMDGVIPLGKLSEVLAGVESICKKYNRKVANVFHAGDGNLHPLILYNANDDVEKHEAEECGNEILKLCVEAGGCLTGEHGVGIEKRELMHVQYNAIDLEQQMQVKTVFDPQWLLNPDKVFPLDASQAYTARLHG